MTIDNSLERETDFWIEIRIKKKWECAQYSGVETDVWSSTKIHKVIGYF